MTTTWIAIAHRTGVRILSRTGVRELVFVESEDHPSGRDQNHDIDTDRPGRTHSRVGPRRSAYGGPNDAHEKEAHAFAHRIARRLHEARVARLFDELVIVAEPRFLGMIRAELAKDVAGCVREFVQKDLGYVATHALGQHLPEHI